MRLLRRVGVHLLTLATFLALDAVWLGLIAREMCRRELGQLLAPGVQWGAAVVAAAGRGFARRLLT
jgi:uncharacterized membrane protein